MLIEDYYSGEVVSTFIYVLLNGDTKPFCKILLDDGRLLIGSYWRHVNEIENNQLIKFTVRSLVKCNYTQVWYFRKLELL